MERAAVAIVYKVKHNTIYVLYIKRRALPRDPWSGHIAFPGGRYREDDKELIDTAIRETYEEVGIDLRKDAVFIGKLDPTWTMVNRNMSIHPFIFKLLTEYDLREYVPNDEVEEAYWIPLNELSEGKCKRFVRSFNDYWLVYCFRWKNVVIWGLTYRITNKLLDNISMLK